MSYQVLARKWRPQKFSEVVGQEHVAKTLKNAIMQNRIGHAYLFIGSRGIGKTTLARIFAKALNCSHNVDGEPCCECENCREVMQGTSLDVIEIDGASHNKVEDIRDIRDNVQYAPVKSKYKIYIIDEVHMLTAAAWNALLKTLEEPPEHVKFLFATTEPHKVLPTIISRCQRFDLRRIPVPLIVQCLRRIADGEKIQVEDAALAAIARAADGGMRDAQSIFDQIISFCGGAERAGGAITERNVIEVFGLASRDELRQLAMAVFANDLDGAITVMQNLADTGLDLEKLFEDLVYYVRNLMIATHCRDAHRFLEVSDSEYEEFMSFGKSLDPALTQRVLQGLVAQEWAFRSALNKRIYLEVILARVMREAHSVQIDDVMRHLNVMSGLLPQDQMPPPLPGRVTAAAGQNTTAAPPPEPSPNAARQEERPLPTENIASAPAPFDAPVAVSAPAESPASAPPPFDVPAAVSAPAESPASAPPPFDAPAAVSAPAESPASVPPPFDAPAAVSAPAESPASAPTPFDESVSVATPFDETAENPAGQQVSAEENTVQALPVPDGHVMTPCTCLHTDVLPCPEDAADEGAEADSEAILDQIAAREYYPEEETYDGDDLPVEDEFGLPVEESAGRNSADELLRQLLDELSRSGEKGASLVPILEQLEAEKCENDILTLTFDQAVVSEQASRTILERENLECIQQAFRRRHGTGVVVIRRKNMVEGDELHKGLQHISGEDMEALEASPVVKLFNGLMNTKVVDAVILEHKDRAEESAGN